MSKYSIKLVQFVVCAALLWFIAACSDDAAIETSNPVSSSNPDDITSFGNESELDGLDSSTHESDSVHEHLDKVASGSLTEFAAVSEGSDALERDELDSGSNEVDYVSNEKVTFDATSSDGLVKWQAPQNKRYVNAKITVSNEAGETAVRNFNPDESIELYGELPDGVYKWKSVITPEIDSSVRERMSAVRASGDSYAEQELAASLRAEGSIPTQQEAQENVQFGSFTVLDGVINPSLVDESEEVER